MGRVADMRFRWDRSVSTDIKKVLVSLLVDGTLLVEHEFTPDVQELLITISANKNYLLKIDSIDEDGLHSVATFSGTLGDLVEPQPATNITAEILGIRDVPDEPLPTGPTGPVEPTGPTGPVEPTGPTGPVEPTGPTA